MLYKECLEIGKDCGLGTPYECIRNISMHCTQIFPYERINAELNELAEDCKKHGVDYNAAFQTICVSGINPETKKAECWMNNIPVDIDSVAWAIDKLRNEGYIPGIATKIGE